MEAKSTRQRWTYAEFARLPNGGSTRYEVIDGSLVVTPGPAAHHQRIVRRLVVPLSTFVEANALGEVFPGPIDVLFAEGDYLEPDIVFVGLDRTHLVSERGVEGPPDLVVEILSPSTAARDRGIKLERYRLFGVAEYWMVDPDERTVEVWHLARGAPSPVLHGLGDTLKWTPLVGGRTLEIELAALFGAMTK